MNEDPLLRELGQLAKEEKELELPQAGDSAGAAAPITYNSH